MIIILIILFSITWLTLPAATFANRSSSSKEITKMAQKEATDSDEHSGESAEEHEESAEEEHGSKAEGEHGDEGEQQEESFWRKIPLWQSIFAFLAVGFFIATSLTILPKIAAKDLEEHH